MPFKSEAQRRYLWANEPEIARDWTDTYGSRIQANLGGIMRLALAFGGTGGKAPGVGGDDNSADRGGNVHQAIAQQAIDTASTRGGDARENAIEKYSTNPYGQKKKGFVGGVMDLYNKFGLIPNAWRLGKKIFGTSVEDENPYSTGRFTVGNPHLNKVTGPTTEPDRDRNAPYDSGYIPPQYNWDDLYAQNVMEEDGLDIDTSTGNLEDWSQRFRLADAYRQHPGTIDTPITYT